LLPRALLDLELAELGLPAPARLACGARGVHTLADLLACDAEALATGGWFGPEWCQQVRDVLTQHWQPSAQPGRPLDTLPEDFESLLHALAPALGPVHFAGLCQLLRLPLPHDAPAVPDGPLARAALRARLLAVAAPVFDQLCRELGAELHAFDGVIDPQHVATGTLLHTLLRDAAPKAAVLELVAFALPQQFCSQGERLFGLPARLLRSAQKNLRRHLDAVGLPQPVAALQDHLAAVGCAVPLGVVLHCLRQDLQLAVVVDPRQGELAIADPRSPTARLLALLAEAPAPLAFDDLAFAYRERHRRCNRSALRQRLAAEPRFLQLGQDLWSLRERHTALLEATAPLAEQVARAIAARGGKQRVAALVAEFGGTAAESWLVHDHLRRDVRVRRLGRGEACPATHARSQVLEQLLLDFRRAGGEVVVSRFLANQPPERRRLVGRLLHENRWFVEPEHDRVDVLTNYPFNPERLRRLLDRVAGRLLRSGGTCTLHELKCELDGTDLGGGWLSLDLLGDLLRRHAGAEVLPGGIAGAPGTTRHLQRTLRTLVRTAARPMTAADLLASRPDLADFAGAIDALLARDPLLQSRDGQHYTPV
jgi:hypothetical protein